MSVKLHRLDDKRLIIQSEGIGGVGCGGILIWLATLAFVLIPWNQAIVCERDDDGDVSCQTTSEGFVRDYVNEYENILASSWEVETKGDSENCYLRLKHRNTNETLESDIHIECDEHSYRFVDELNDLLRRRNNKRIEYEETSWGRLVFLIFFFSAWWILGYFIVRGARPKYIVFSRPLGSAFLAKESFWGKLRVKATEQFSEIKKADIIKDDDDEDPDDYLVLVLNNGQQSSVLNECLSWGVDNLLGRRNAKEIVIKINGFLGVHQTSEDTKPEDLPDNRS